MKPKLAISALAIALLLAALGGSRAQQAAAPSPAAVQIDSDDIGGVVTSRFGPESGVWVIAETRDLGTRFAKMVATDERGRYVIPDLPKANYRVWVRGYGLVDSPKIAARPGQHLDLQAVTAPSLAAAAQYYPAIYWAAMIKIPDLSRFPGTGDKGNGIPPAVQDAATVAQFHQDQRLRQLSPDRQLRDALPVAEARPFRFVARRLGVPAVGRAGWP